ncbi:basic-leucine zipper transcription factor A isoform X2 [Chelonus insularis]|uniref:basic-leucine zipper transcription factor A isoform X2 n=1 Tax=Chelonus insularis TaxID=460826 RepID=UPI00158A51DF|nr:basic-leucine zipper transcription factor A isoform X2 [Chelonus insularis]
MVVCNVTHHGCTWRETKSTCVWESDFGFTFVCSFKKSGLFRVRNLGGVKGYVGLGFTVGDELGFRESISNLEASKRRSVQTGRENFITIGNGGVKKENPRTKVVTGQGTNSVPPFKPLPSAVLRPMAQQPEHQRLVVQQNSSALRTIPAPVLMQKATAVDPKVQQQHQRNQYEMKSRQQQKIQQELLAHQVLKEQQQQQQEAMQQKLLQQQSQYQATQVKPQLSNVLIKRIQTLPNIVAAIPPAGSVVNIQKRISKPKPDRINVANNGLPAFIAMPQSSTHLTDRISNSSVILIDSANQISKDNVAEVPFPSEEMSASVSEMTLQSLNPVNTAEALKSSMQKNEKRQSLLAPIQEMETSLKALAEASNVTLEALEAAILLRQQQLMEKHQSSTTTTTTTTTTTSPPPLPPSSPSKTGYPHSGATKVMNAPREYYPTNYEKNFDDNFASRVDLPDTSFYCGDQKHFPGLYADEDLGCMVFHVCALTDQGLIMKSFLCPESTLFDQTILKCNWWFYVDCKASKSLYDSNIPISKSYQLMKALAFFSAYKNHENDTSSSE